MNITNPKPQIAETHYYGRRDWHGCILYNIVVRQQDVEPQLRFRIEESSYGRNISNSVYFQLEPDDIITMGKQLIEMAEDFKRIKEIL